MYLISRGYFMPSGVSKDVVAGVEEVDERRRIQSDSHEELDERSRLPGQHQLILRVISIAVVATISNANEKNRWDSPLGCKDCVYANFMQNVNLKFTNNKTFIGRK